ncbi:type VII secretion protein EssB [Streptococcus gordonii]|uniref:type VII secretion protein EssB n=1 Tax=Streptococcus gordonii TaxID=1302 RepID=UPI0006604D73|nr:type VII secretion protein EssB [Streptococcus gordonii]MBZ2131823.1 type VII secretion protein EssB [Streptococcus gordonii]MCY7131646.1 type VII secretion protein EssB [Streptococcus gordonii]MCY7142019.1 type VII secretion protein EssB [Streptococcus gordonii]
MTEEKFVYGEQTFTYEKSDKEWKLSLRRSDVATQDLRELLILDLHHPLFLEQTMDADEDGLTFTYQLEPHSLSYEEVKSRPISERIRLALNVFALEAALELPVTFLLHPSNLMITKDAQAKIAYRGVPGIMTPEALTAEDFLRQAKCFAATLFADVDFMELYNGSLELETLPDFLVELREAEDQAAAVAVLEKAYLDKTKEEKATLIQVSSRWHRVFKLASIWLSVAVVLLIIPLIYLIFLQNPFKEKLLQADTAFIKVDYSGVITELEGIAPSSLPTTQKYELAYSYIQGLEFSSDQKKVILNNVSLKSDELYLIYWIQIGRNTFEDALDTAKRINDNDLILYALAQEIKQVREDDKLSGKDRESKLSSLEGEYKKYWDSRSELLTSDSSSSDSSEKETSSTEASSSTETSASSSH